MKLKQTHLNIRTSSAEKAMLEQVAQAHETTPSEMMRQLIREAYAKENIMNGKLAELKAELEKALNDQNTRTSRDNVRYNTGFAESERYIRRLKTQIESLEKK